jgi:primosomal protein N' (replication factor Y)
MLASIVIEYNAKSLNKVFDYLIPEDMVNILKVGHKVIVPFASHEVEGFVLKIHNDIDESLDYKKIIKIQDNDFYLNDELLKLGEYLSKSLL